jgi:hypothetical protein
LLVYKTKTEFVKNIKFILSIKIFDCVNVLPPVYAQ